MSTDASSVLVDGPWQHRFVPANGARFHVAEQGEGPLVVLLHGFPQFWWAWRGQMTGAGRRRLPRRRDGPARLRRLGQAAARLRHVHPGRRRRQRHPLAGREGRDGRRARLGRVDRLVDAHHAARGDPRGGRPVDAAPAGPAPGLGDQPGPDPRQRLPRRPATAVRARTADDQGVGLRRRAAARLGRARGPLAVPRGRRALRRRDGAALRGPLRGGVLPVGRPQPAAARRPALRPAPAAAMCACRSSTSRATATARSPRPAPAARRPTSPGRYEEHVIAGAGHFLPEEAPEAVNAHLIRWLDRLG